jgi:hypothetical protein
MPPRKRLAALITIAVIGAAVAGCGSNEIDGTIPPADADQLVDDLDAIEAATADNDCVSAEARAEEFRQHVDELPATSGVALKEALRGAGDNLEQLVRDPCASGATGASGQQSSDSRSSDTDSTEPPTPPTTAPTPPTTAPTPPTRSEPSAPPGGGNQGGGNENTPPGGQGGDNQGGGGGSPGDADGTGGTGVGGGG